MSTEKNESNEVLLGSSPAVASPQESLSDVDKVTLENGKLTRKLALSKAETALAENNAAEATYKYLILQLYMKYGMTQMDAIDDNGNILRGYNTPKAE